MDVLPRWEQMMEYLAAGLAIVCLIQFLVLKSE